MKMTQRNEKKHRGFTLVEVMVVFLIFLALFDAIWLIYKSSLSTTDILSESMSAQEEARKAFTSMTAGLRSASQSSTGSYPISAASSTALTYYSDIDHDGLKEQIRYFLVGSTLKQGIIKPTGSPSLVYLPSNERITNLVRHVIRDDTKPIFTYYDGSYDGGGPGLSNPPAILSIRLIKIRILVDQTPLTPPAPTEFTTQVSIRNLKDNL